MNKMLTCYSVLSLIFGFFTSPSALAQIPGAPHCRDASFNVLGLENERVVQLKKTTQNNYKEQVLVKAYLVKMLPNTTNSFGTHEHFIVSLADPSSVDFKNMNHLIEIADSLNDYTSPSANDLTHGPIYICGEYATTNVNGTPAITTFTPSVTGAMIHWTHLAGPSVDGHYSHPNGWIFVNGLSFGFAQLR